VGGQVVQAIDEFNLLIGTWGVESRLPLQLRLAAKVFGRLGERPPNVRAAGSAFSGDQVFESTSLCAAPSTCWNSRNRASDHQTNGVLRLVRMLSSSEDSGAYIFLRGYR
jgi:hypothetical protein